MQLKSSLKYSTNICKQCFKELISSLEFQQKIINNQARLHFYEDEATELKFEDIKEEPELDVMPEIKTECFEFGSLVTQTWIEDEHSQSRNEAATLFEFEDSSILDSKTPPDDLTQQKIKNSKAQKKSFKSTQSQVCPYCGVICSSGLSTHASCSNLVIRVTSKLFFSPNRLRLMKIRSTTRRLFVIYASSEHFIQPIIKPT